MRKLLLHLASGVLGLWLAVRFAPGVEIKPQLWQTYIIIGVIIGLVNFFIKPILNLITLPLRMLTLGLSGIVINMGLIWIISIFFNQLIISGILALFWLTLIIWSLNTLLPLLWPKK